MGTSNEFISSIKKHGLARTNRFRAEIVLPEKLANEFSTANETDPNAVFAKATKLIKTIVTGRSGDFSRGLDLMCESASIPGFSFLTSEKRENSPTVKVPYGVQFDDVNLTFFLSSDMLEKKIFDSWKDIIYDHKNHSFSYEDEYTTRISIHHLNERNETTHTVTLLRVMPLIITPIDYNVGQNEPAKLQVTFAYQKWIEGIDDSAEEGGFFDKIKSPSDLLDVVSSPKVLNKVYDIAVGNNPGFAGESLAVYDKIKELTVKYADISPNELGNIISTIKNDLSSNSDINATDKTSLNNIADSIINRIKG